MARKRRTEPSSLPIQLDFEAVLARAEKFSRDQVAANTDQERNSREYDPIQQTVGYMQRAVELEDAWHTIIQKARDALLHVDARQLYMDFFHDLKQQIEQNTSRSDRLAELVESVAIRGLGMTKQQVQIHKPAKGGTRWRVTLNDAAIQAHLDRHIVGEHFLNSVEIDDTVWQERIPLIGSSDVSQHRSAVPVPARFFKRSVPFILNNAAGTMFRIKEGAPSYENVFNPKPDEALLRWMLIDPSYQDELDPEDYQRCIASAMDVGQYKFDLEYLLKADRPPQIVFRDGSIFPQDAYLDNFVVESKRGEFTREAIRELLNCLLYAREIGVIYCGVSKNVQLKVYSAVVDWFIERHIDSAWNIGNYTLNDGQAMSLLLSSPSFVGDNLQKAVATCLIRRSYTTRANLNVRAGIDSSDLQFYFHRYESQHNIDINPFRRLCEIAHLYMFFVGHSKTPQQQLPRYEFFYTESLGPVQDIARKILASIQHCGLMIDEDHSFMADSPVVYLLPSVVQQAHLISKDVGKYIDTATGQWIMARYKNLLKL
jgi:hypothetical protein